MRRHVSSIVLSRAAPSGPLRRYFMSQICWEMAAIGVIRILDGRRLLERSRARGSARTRRRVGNSRAPPGWGQRICSLGVPRRNLSISTGKTEMIRQWDAILLEVPLLHLGEPLLGISSRRDRGQLRTFGGEPGAARLPARHRPDVDIERREALAEEPRIGSDSAF